MHPLARGGPRRRSLLAAGLLLPLLPLSGCTSARPPRPLPPPDPDLALRAAALVREQQLLGLYDAALAAPTSRQRAVLVALRAEHATHLAALQAGALPPSRAATPVPTGPTTVASPHGAPPTPAALRTAEAQAAAAHAAGVVPASRPLAALLASLSAAEAAHAVALA